MTREGTTDMGRIIGLIVALAAVIWARSTVVENIHPWQPLWMLWVGGTCLVSGCLGYVLCGVLHHRRDQRN